MIIPILVSGSIYALIAIGFALAFRVSHVFNVAHGGVMLAAAYANYYLLHSLHLPVPVSLFFAVGAGGLLGFCIEALIIPSAVRRGLNSLELLIISWFALLIIQNSLRLSFSSESIIVGPTTWTQMSILGGQLTSIQLAIFAISLTLGILLALSTVTNLNREIIAVGTNPLLATIAGLRVRRLLAINSWIVGLVTGSAGILISYQERLDPDAGFRFSIIAIIATLIGLKLGPAGSILGAFLLAFLENLVLYKIDPGLRDAAVFIALIILLLTTQRDHGSRAATNTAAAKLTY